MSSRGNFCYSNYEFRSWCSCRPVVTPLMDISMYYILYSMPEALLGFSGRSLKSCEHVLFWVWEKEAPLNNVYVHASIPTYILKQLYYFLMFFLLFQYPATKINKWKQQKVDSFVRIPIVVERRKVFKAAPTSGSFEHTWGTFEFMNLNWIYYYEKNICIE